jgi:putative ABC transport system permease protein
MLRNYFLVAIRGMMKNKLFSFITVFGLALALAVCMLPILKVKEAFDYDAFHPYPQRTFRITTHSTEGGTEGKLLASSPLVLRNYLLEHYPSIEKATRIDFADDNVLVNGIELSAHGIFADRDFNDIFNFTISKGTSFNEARTMNITDATAKRFFGSENPIGKVVRFSDAGEFTITGVIASDLGPSHLKFDFVASISSIELQQAKRFNSWTNAYDGYIYVLLKNTIRQSMLDDLLTKVSAHANEKELKNVTTRYTFGAQRLDKISPATTPIYNTTAEPILPNLFGLIAIGAAILFLALINYVNLSVATSISRAREVGVRKVNGAQQGQIRFQFLCASVLTALVAFGLAQVFFRLMMQLPTIHGFVGNVRQDIRLLIYYFAFTIGVGILAGWVPSRIFSKLKPVNILKGKFDIKMLAGFGMRKTLIVLQFATSLAAIITVVIFFKQSFYMATADYGFNQKNVLNIRISPEAYAPLAAQLSSFPEVTSVSATSSLFGLMGGEKAIAHWEGGVDSVQVNVFSVTPSIVSTLDLSLLGDVRIPANEVEQRQLVIINEEMIREMNLKSNDIVGRTVNINAQQYRVAGVVRDFHYATFLSRIQPMIFRYASEDFRFMNVSVTNVSRETFISKIEREWKKIFPKQPMQATWYDEALYDMHLHREDIQFISLLTAMAIVLASLGLTGIVTLTITNRSKELNIRKIIGASVLDLFGTAAKDFVLLLVIATCIGIPIGFFIADSLLQQYAYRVAITGWLLMACGGSVILLGLLIILASTGRVITEKPIEKLRME